MRGNLRGKGEKLRKFTVGTVILVVPVDVKASAEMEAQVLEACGGGEEAATAAMVKPIGNQLGMSRDGPADGLNL